MVATAAPTGDPVTPTRPLDGGGRWLRGGLVAAIAALGVWLAIAAASYRPAAVFLAGAVVAVAVVAVAVLPWQRWAPVWHAVPVMSLLPAAVLLELATSGHAEFAFLTLVPVIWAALFHSWRVVILTLALVGLTIFAPPLLVPAAFPGTSWATLGLFYLLACAGGLAVHYLVSRGRASAAVAWAATAEAQEAVHEARVATRRARADRDLMNAYLDSAGCLVVVLDRSGRVQLFNRFAEQLLGFRSEEVVGRVQWERAVHDDRARMAFERVVAGEWPLDYEDDVVTRWGTRRRIAFTATGLTDETGQVTHAVSTGVDITEQRAAERLFANVLSAAADQMITALDTTGTFTVFNAGAERFLGYRAEEVIGEHTVELICLPEDLAEVMAAVGVTSLPELFAHPVGAEIVTLELTLVCKDGARFPAVVSVSAMRDADEVVGYVAVARDITAEREAAAAMQGALEREREAAERLRQLDQVKNDFVATVSHDLRTPLTSIIGNAELLLDGDAGSLAVGQHRLLDAVDRNARRLDSLVGDLLLLSRIESGTLRMHPRPVAMGEIIDGALESLAAKLSTDVQLEVDTPHQPVLVQGDRDQLERVATNLLSNALKFTPPGGRVTVAVVVENEQVRLTISDTGIGIPTEDLPHVFDRFYRSSRSQQKDRPGTGLGLTIAKSIVEQHGGTIGAGPNPAGGATFTVMLPRLPATADKPEKEPA